MCGQLDRKSTRLNSSHTEISTLSLHDALPICSKTGSITLSRRTTPRSPPGSRPRNSTLNISYVRTTRSEEHTSELQSHRDLHSFPTRRSSDLLEDWVDYIIETNHAPLAAWVEATQFDFEHFVCADN